MLGFFGVKSKDKNKAPPLSPYSQSLNASQSDRYPELHYTHPSSGMGSGLRKSNSNVSHSQWSNRFPPLNEDAREFDVMSSSSISSNSTRTSHRSMPSFATNAETNPSPGPSSRNAFELPISPISNFSGSNLSPISRSPSPLNTTASYTLFLKTTLCSYSKANTDKPYFSSSYDPSTTHKPFTEKNSEHFINERHFIVPSSFTLLQLHVILQIIHGLADCPSHPHRFYRPPTSEKGYDLRSDAEHLVHSRSIPNMRFRNQKSHRSKGLPSRRCQPGGNVLDPWEDSPQKDVEKDIPFYQIIGREDDLWFTSYAPGCFIAHSHPHDLPVVSGPSESKDYYQYFAFRHNRDERVFRVDDVLTNRHPIFIYEYDDIQLDIRFEITIELKDVVVYREHFGQVPQCMAGNENVEVLKLEEGSKFSLKKLDSSELDEINSTLSNVHHHSMVKSLRSHKSSSSIGSNVDRRPRYRTSSLDPFYSTSKSRPRSISERSQEVPAANNVWTSQVASSSSESVTTESVALDTSSEKTAAEPHTFVSFSSINGDPGFETSSQFPSLTRRKSSQYDSLPRSTLSRSSSEVFLSNSRSAPPKKQTPGTLIPAFSPYHRNSITAYTFKCYMCRRYHLECKSDLNQACVVTLRNGTAQGSNPTSTESCCEYCLLTDRGTPYATISRKKGPITFSHHSAGSSGGSTGQISLRPKRSSSFQFFFGDDNSTTNLDEVSNTSTDGGSLSRLKVGKVSKPFSASDGFPNTAIDNRETQLDILYKEKKKVLEEARKEYLLSGECVSDTAISGINPCKHCKPNPLQRWDSPETMNIVNFEEEEELDDEENVESGSVGEEEEGNVMNDSVVKDSMSELFNVFGKWGTETVSEDKNKIAEETEEVVRRTNEKLDHLMNYDRNKRVSWYWDLDGHG